MDTLVMPRVSRCPAQYAPTPKTERVLDNDFFLSLIKDVHAGVKPTISRNEVLRAVDSGNIDPDIVEELEDAIFGTMIEAGMKTPSVSREEIMKTLRR